MFAEFYNSNLYHIMKDNKYTICSIYVAAQTDDIKTYADTEYPMPSIVSSPSPDRKLCPKCAEKTRQP